MYMLSYKNRTFKTHNTIEECKEDAIIHAMQNSRLKGEYLIVKIRDLGNGLVSTDLTEKIYKGIKHGKSIDWI